MLIIDGEQAGFDGDALGKCLGLSMVTQTPFRLENFQSQGRSRGFRRRDISLVCAAAEVCDAELTGLSLGSDALSFRPRPVQCGVYKFSLGAAQSTGSLLLSLLPALMLGDDVSKLELEGGTHVSDGPAFHYLDRVFIPVLEQIGPRLRLELERPGFYPAGGGKLVAEITPAPELSSWEVYDSGRSLKKKATVLLAHGSKSAAERQLERVRKKLSWAESECHIEVVKDAVGPGHVLMLETIRENINALFCGYGAPNRKSEAGASDAVDALRRYVAQRVPVDPLLAELLILPLALAQGGEFRTMELTEATKVTIQVAQRFLDVDVRVEHTSRADATVSVRP